MSAVPLLSKGATPNPSYVERPEEPDMSFQKLKQVALTFFTGICLVTSGVLFSFHDVVATLYAVPFLLASGAAVWSLIRTKDYTDEIELREYRREATSAPLEETVKRHGWQNMFRYEIPCKESFQELFTVALMRMGTESAEKFYEQAKAAREQVNPDSPLVLPPFPNSLQPQEEKPLGVVGVYVTVPVKTDRVAVRFFAGLLLITGILSLGTIGAGGALAALPCILLACLLFRRSHKLEKMQQH